MSKYDPLYDYLRRRNRAEERLSFRDVEIIIKAMLPNSAARPQWWSNEKPETTRHVQSLAWTKAGYAAELVGNEEVLFRRRASASA